MTGEFRWIERLKSLIPRSLQGPFPLGDDAAIVPLTRKRSLLFTTDVICEGVDFRLGQGGATGEQVGHKALAVNLSDLAAMGGRPLAFVSAWGIPIHFSERWLERVTRGMVRLAKRFQVSWVGGDLSRSSRFFISVALLGEVESKRAVERRGACVGDGIYVTGELGGSILGRHLRFTPRVQEGEWLATHFSLRAMIDVSDGFIQDLEHLLKASRVSAQVELGRIPISKAAWQRGRGERKKALRSALSDGEDFELLFTVGSSEGGRLEKAWKRKFPRVRLTRVGRIVKGPHTRIEWRINGEKLPRLWFEKKGFSHF